MNKQESQTGNEQLGGRADRSKLPYEITSVEGDTVSFVFNGKSYTVALTAEMGRYLLDAGLRTRISAAGAGKDKGLMEMVQAAENLEKGIVGRVGFNVEALVADISELGDIADVATITPRIIAAPKSKQSDLFEKLNDRIVELAAV